ncbi:Probable protein phosphatase 2C 4 [Ancistrocladus abbreviatus]
MGNGVGKLSVCFTGGGRRRRSHDVNMLISEPCDEGLGHSFCYVRPDPSQVSSSKVHSEDSTAATTIFRTISGASVSANTSTSLSTAFDSSSAATNISSAFESSSSFASIPLQPIPRNSIHSGPLSGVLVPNSGPMIERGFMSGPIERGFLSGPLDRGGSGSLYSGPLDKGGSVAPSVSLTRSLSHGGWSAFGPRSRPGGSLIRGIRKAISKTLSRGQNSIVAPIKGVASIKYQDSWIVSGSDNKINENLTVSSANLSRESSFLDDVDSLENQNLQWAQGKAGEDRVHVVVSEEHGWAFVGIYDGFNGPDATDFLLSNLYAAVHKELEGLLWDDQFDSTSATSTIGNCGSSACNSEIEGSVHDFNHNCLVNSRFETCSQCLELENYPSVSGASNFDSNSMRKRSRNSKGRYSGVGKKWEENQRRWKCEWDRERLELDRRLKGHLTRSNCDESKAINHSDVLKALSQALKKTEEAYLDIADKMVVENPELALMGSCVLVMLMKGQDVYVMNVGDSRAVLGQKSEPDLRLGKIDQDLERINEETFYDLQASDAVKPSLSAFQLSFDHGTSVEEEVQRIRSEHPDDVSAVVNDRVKGSLKVTRAFGAGFLKQPKWNDALLAMFRIDYVGASPYINCIPSLCHHRLGPKDRFLILSSDGLYQYFTNEEAVSEVELFISLSPEGDPAQHLVEEVLFRAAKKAGMDFYELLEIPQGDRRKYHDDVSIIVISFEGRIWRSCV